jgi:hypothetical protein
MRSSVVSKTPTYVSDKPFCLHLGLLTEYGDTRLFRNVRMFLYRHRRTHVPKDKNIEDRASDIDYRFFVSEESENTRTGCSTRALRMCKRAPRQILPPPNTREQSTNMKGFTPLSEAPRETLNVQNEFT